MSTSVVLKTRGMHVGITQTPVRAFCDVHMCVQKHIQNLSLSLTCPCAQETSHLHCFCSFKSILCIWVRVYVVYMEWGWGGDKTMQPWDSGEDLRRPGSGSSLRKQEPLTFPPTTKQQPR